jgi:propionyl-CoA synthetase
MTSYEEAYAEYLADPDGFWLEGAKSVPWFRKPTIARNETGWFPDGMINGCYACLDCHVEAGFGKQAALIYDSPVAGQKRRFSYADLLKRVAAFSAGLRTLGVGHGGRVLIYMPMIPEAVIAMLATARLGAIHSVVFGGFAAAELAKRIDDFEPQVIVTASCGIEVGRVIPYQPLVREALSISKAPAPSVIVAQRPQADFDLGQEQTFDFEAVCDPQAEVPCHPCKSTDPLYVLYTSGTTGAPKGVVRDIGGYVAALRWSMSNIYGVEAGDVFWAASDIGWVVGHSYIVYGPLAQRCTTVLYEGKPVGTPDAGAMWRVIDEYAVKVAFTAPTAIRAIKREDSDGRLIRPERLACLESLFLAGERADPDTINWATEKLGVQVIDHWWQTELGWPALGAFPGMNDGSVRVGSAGRPVPGFSFVVVNEAGHIASKDETGSILIQEPLAPGCTAALWNAPGRFKSEYLERFPGYYLTGDAGFIDEDGFVHVMGRTDDIINTAGHRLSTGAIEEAICGHPAIAEAAVLGAADPLKGQVPVAFVVLKSSAKADPKRIERELVARVRKEVGPVASFKTAHVVAQLPKTRSGKILRKTLRAIVDGEDYVLPATIDDPEILQRISQQLATSRRGT